MAYGEDSYGTIDYGTDSSVSINSEPYIPDLMKYLPTYYDNSYIMKSIQTSLAKEVGLIDYSSDDLLNQFFIDTATWGLSIWETTVGLPINSNDTYEDRRQMIKAKIRGIGTVTKQMIENAAEAFSGGDVNVIEHFSDYSFTIQFIGVLGIPKNLEAFKELIDTIKPAHLSYDFKYTYTIWNFLKNNSDTWNSINSKTWDALRVYSNN